MPASEHTYRTLYRDPDHAVFGGVCAGIAEYLNIDVLLARITAIVLFILSCSLVSMLYLVFWTILPVRESESSVIDIEPVSASSLYHDRIITTNRPRNRQEKNASDMLREELGKAPAQSLTQKQLVALRLPLVVLGLLCMFITVGIIAIVSATPDVEAIELLPLYLIVIGVMFLVLPNTGRALSARICSMVLSFEVCAILLAFSIGVCDIEMLPLMGNATFLVWFFALIVSVAAVVFDNTTCYMISICLIIVAATMACYDFGLFEPADLIAYLNPGFTSALER